MRRLAEWLYGYRVAAVLLIAAVTVWLGVSLRNVDISTHFLDLYPYNDPNFKLFRQYPKFGTPLTVTLLIKVKHGDIYNPETLAKIHDATEMFSFVPGVDNDGIVSIASRKAKHVRPTPTGFTSEYLMLGATPKTPEQVADLRARLRDTPGIIGRLVSTKENAALVQATFIERLVDYGAIFTSIMNMAKKLSDSNHEVYVAGDPILTGYIYQYTRRAFAIFAIGLSIMVMLLVLYFRNFTGVVVPTLVAVISLVWGFGLAAVLGINLDLLMVVVPVLLMGRAHSHSIQMCERYFELSHKLRDKKQACIGSLASLFPPGTVGIVCDASGILLISLAPIPLIQKVAYVCVVMSLTFIITALITTFLLLSFLPVPRNIQKLLLQSENVRGVSLPIFKFINFFSANPRRAFATCLFFLALTISSAWAALHRNLGDVNPGTSLLWPQSPYNQAVAEINRSFPGYDVLQVVLESSKELGTEGAVGLDTLARFENYMQQDPQVGGTFSFADMVPGMNMLLNGGLPRWDSVPVDPKAAPVVARLAMTGASASDFDPWVTPRLDAANVDVWYKDHRGATIERALYRAQSFVDSNQELLAKNGLTLRVAAGELGLLAAINHTVGRYEIITVILISLVIFGIASFIYQSLTAGLVLLVISNIAYLLTSAIMYLKGIGLNVDTFPVAAVGIGIGIDYNIYLMSRMCEEYLVNPDYSSLIPASILTTGKAIFFTCETMVVGVVMWYFVSDLRFQAEMGLLLGSVMIAHAVLALFFQAAMMQLLQPQFIKKGLIFRRG